MNFGKIVLMDCVNRGVESNPNCDDPAYALLNPGQCGPVPRLVIKPSNALCCLLGGIQYNVVQIQNGVETDVTASCTFQTSSATTAVIGATSGRATGVGAGDALITANYGNLTAQAELTVLADEDQCCDKVPVALMVLVDRSRSMSQSFGTGYSTKMAFAKAAATRFISEINGIKDYVGLISFDDSASTLMSDLTHDEDYVAGLVPSISQGSQLTGFTPAINAAVASLNASGATQLVIVIISDGVDTSAVDSTDVADAVAAAQSFKDGGGVVMCLGARASGNGFNLLETLSSGGFFVNGYNATAADALNSLSGLKGYVCAGNCTPTGDDYESHGKFDYCGFANWNVVGGHVDLLGKGFLDYLPGNGLYIELAGSSAPNGGKLISKNSFSLESGHDYRLSLNLAGNQRVAGSPNTVQMRVFGRNNDGLTDPASAPVLTVNEAGAVLVSTPTYKYVYTYTNANGETAPSPMASATPAEDGASIVVQATANASALKIRIYRTTGEAPDSPFYMIAEIANTAPAYTDYMNEADMLAAISAGTVDACAIVSDSNTTGSMVNYLNQQVSLNNHQQGFTPQSFNFTSPANVDVWISFQQTAFPAGAISTGLLLDSVSFDDTTDITNLLSDDFSTENTIYIDPACGVGNTYVPVGPASYVQTGTGGGIGNLVPDMTGPSTPSGVASASTESFLAPSWLPFDGHIGSGSWGAIANCPQWLQYQFPTAKLITSYLISVPTTYPDEIPTDWELQGSDNGSDWTTLDSQSGVVWPLIDIYEQQTFDIPSPQSFAYYRLLMTSCNGGAAQAPIVDELELIGSNAYQNYGYVTPYGYISGYACYGFGCLDTPPPVQLQDPNPLPDIESGYTPPVSYQSTQTVCAICPGGQVNYPAINLIPAMTSDSTPSGVASSSEEQGGSEAWKAFSRLGGTTLWSSITSTMPQWLRYQFASPTSIGAYTVQSGKTAPTDWTLEGSNDGTTWTVLDAQSGQSWGQFETKQFLLAAATSAFGYFRLNISATSVPNLYVNVAAFALFAAVANQACATASATSDISQADADAKAVAAANVAAESQLNCVQGFLATESYKADCPLGEVGSAIRTATASSLVSQLDAQTKALALAKSQAEAALVCQCGDTSESAITIPGTGKGSPYPSVKCVSDVEGIITAMTVTLHGFAHTYPSDVSIILVSPAGTIVNLMRNCGNGDNVTGLEIVFDDFAGSPLPENSVLSAGTFLPSQYGLFAPFPLPCPPGTPETTLAAFNTESPNGAWTLWISDNAGLDSGQIAGGFDLDFSTAIEDENP